MATMQQCELCHSTHNTVTKRNNERESW